MLDQARVRSNTEHFYKYITLTVPKPFFGTIRGIIHTCIVRYLSTVLVFVQQSAFLKLSAANSVADPDPGFGAFLAPPGSGIRDG